MPKVRIVFTPQSGSQPPAFHYYDGDGKPAYTLRPKPGELIRWECAHPFKIDFCDSQNNVFKQTSPFSQSSSAVPPYQSSAGSTSSSPQHLEEQLVQGSGHYPYTVTVMVGHTEHPDDPEIQIDDTGGGGINKPAVIAAIAGGVALGIGLARMSSKK